MSEARNETMRDAKHDRRAGSALLLALVLAGAGAAQAQELVLETGTDPSVDSYTEAFNGSLTGAYAAGTVWPATFSSGSITVTGVEFPDIPGSIAVTGLTIEDPDILVGSLIPRGDGSTRVTFPGVTAAFSTTDGFSGDLIFDLQTSGEAPGSPGATIASGCGLYTQTVNLFGTDWDESTGEITLVGHDCYELGISGITRAFVVVVRGTLNLVADPCGNGLLDPGEECDDGNNLDGDCCDSSCNLETTTGSDDFDGDGLADSCDNCINIANGPFSPDPGGNVQRDSDGDGYGNVCDADLNDDGTVDFLDLGLLKARFFSADADADLNGDGNVDFLDLGSMKARFFQPPGPSGLTP